MGIDGIEVIELSSYLQYSVTATHPHTHTHPHAHKNTQAHRVTPHCKSTRGWQFKHAGELKRRHRRNRSHNLKLSLRKKGATESQSRRLKWSFKSLGLRECDEAISGLHSPRISFYGPFILFVSFNHELFMKR